MRTLKAALLLTGMYGLCSCSSAFKGPSTDSDLLQRLLAPRIVQWGAGSAQAFSLAQVSLRRSYDLICLVPEYSSLGRLTKYTTITSFHSDFGAHVPENRLAIVAVRDGTAHAAIMTTMHGLNAEIFGPAKPCVNAAGASLIRGVSKHGTPVIRLVAS